MTSVNGKDLIMYVCTWVCVCRFLSKRLSTKCSQFREVECELNTTWC